MRNLTHCGQEWVCLREGFEVPRHSSMIGVASVRAFRVVDHVNKQAKRQSQHPLSAGTPEREKFPRFPKSPGKERLVLLVLHKQASGQHLPLSHPFRLVAFWR
jgi:hypothetical protein